MKRQHDGVPSVGAGTGTRSGGSPIPKTLVIRNVLVAAGIFGPILFTVGFVVQGLYRPTYNPIAQQISDLTAGPSGWVQQVNFLVFGLLVIVFAGGLYRGGPGAAPKVLGPALVAWNGVELVIAGIFPLSEDAAGRVYDPIGVHSANGTIFFLSIGAVLCVMAWWFARDARWRGLVAYTLVTGIALLVLFLLNGFLAETQAAPLHPWLGLIQRATLAVWFLYLIILALRLRDIGRWRGEYA